MRALCTAVTRVLCEMVAGTMAAPGTMAEAVAFQLEAFLALEGDDEQYVRGFALRSWLVACFAVFAGW